MQLLEATGKQILIVEDEGIIAADIQNRLEQLGYRVPAVVRSGEEAVRLARSTPFDLVLMDIRLKGEMDGISAAHILRTEVDAPVVYITAHADEDTLDRATRTEPFGYILKPIRDSELRTAVRISIHKHEMERRIRASEAWLATTLRSIGEGVIATDTGGAIVFMNPVAELLTGRSAAEGLGQPLMEVLGIHDELTGAAVENPLAALQAGHAATANHQEYLLTSRAGAGTPIELCWFENRTEEEVLGAILVLRDITSRRELEGRIMQSQRMEAIANLAAGLAHDFNNQLTLILGCAEELCQHLGKPHQDRALEIKRAGLVAASITNQLLTLSRRQSIRTEALDLNSVVSEMQPALSGALGKSCVLTTALGTNCGLVRVDRNQVKQVLLNLALNARDAMPGGGEFRIEVSNMDIHPRSPKARLFPAGRYVRMLTSDTGHGMDQLTLARIFEPFFTTKRPGLGTGLGLSMVHSIVVQSGGQITARSEPGLGTAMEILFPRLAQRPNEDRESGAPRADGGEEFTILLVEDEDGVREMMRAHLERAGYRLLTAHGGKEAERISGRQKHSIHVLITDVNMPGGSGPELADRLQRSRSDMRVLMISGFPQSSPDPHREFLAKPFSSVQLLKKVRALITSSALEVQPCPSVSES